LPLYEAAVNAYNAAGGLVGGDQAPKYGRDGKTAKPIVSYDKAANASASSAGQEG
jgi:hypothetical protein